MTKPVAGLSRAAAALALLAGVAGCIPRTTPPPGYGGAPIQPPVPAAPTMAEGARASDLARDEPLPPLPPAQAPPVWTARPVVPDARTIPDASYTVVSGDTLSGIGDRTGVGTEALARANGIAPPYRVQAGQHLRIPGGRYHGVHAGDTGIAIARAYGVSWSEVATLNDLQPPYLLRTGQKLALPSASAVASRSMEQRADAFRLNIDDLATGLEPALAEGAAPARPTRTPGKPVPATVAVAPPARFSGRFGWPLEGRIIGRFGPGEGGRRNDGINIAAERGAPIRAAADGVVAYAGSAIAVYGGLVLLKHGEGWITAYGHAEDILVARGQSVKRGQIIGRAGATGSVNTPQLHFEIREKRTPVDPLRYLPPQG